MTLLKALERVAKRTSGHGVRLLSGDSGTVERVGFDQLHAQALKVAGGLLERGVARGERVAIALPSSVDFLRAFFGVLAAGAVPVPMPPPFRFAALEIHMRRISLAMRRSGVEKILTNESFGELLGPAIGSAGGEFSIHVVGSLLESTPAFADVAANEPALVQYTSGTSGSPKGVVLTHENLLANVSAITEALQITEADVVGAWLPLFHDMGLVGACLCSILNDAELCLLPPEDFLRDPTRWVRMISEHRVSITMAPNSGYLHTLRRTPAEAVPDFDLSSWRLALNGAEAVDAEVMRKFTEHFAPAEFSRTAFLPVYGLAEAALGVAFPPIDRPVRTTWVRRDLLGEGIAATTSEGAQLAREIASVGGPLSGLEVRIVDEGGSELRDEARVGELQVRGSSVTRGYEADEQATRTAVAAGAWAHTGDLAFRLDDEWYIVGRKKETIIVFGQNYHASDIESVAGRVPGIAIHGVLAVGVPTPEGERLGLLVETREKDPAARGDLRGQLRYAVSAALGITPSEVVFVDKGRLPRTSSGKLQRHGIQELYEECAQEAAASLQPGEKMF
ncbi:fatty acyl-AMP ligase [Streptomyces sp. NPDC004647]|uniref:fatty acyl-AMP ligase n=1 Tax=Streptomyces sp. NPDC004647 TaxID=3154671 RepID=UPI0033A00C89